MLLGPDFRRGAPARKQSLSSREKSKSGRRAVARAGCSTWASQGEGRPGPPRTPQICEVPAPGAQTHPAGWHAVRHDGAGDGERAGFVAAAAAGATETAAARAGAAAAAEAAAAVARTRSTAAIPPVDEGRRLVVPLQRRRLSCAEPLDGVPDHRRTRSKKRIFGGLPVATADARTMLETWCGFDALLGPSQHVGFAGKKLFQDKAHTESQDTGRCSSDLGENRPNWQIASRIAPKSSNGGRVRSICSDVSQRSPSWGARFVSIVGFGQLWPAFGHVSLGFGHIRDDVNRGLSPRHRQKPVRSFGTTSTDPVRLVAFWAKR